MSRIIHLLSDLSGQYDAVLCDVWGVYHNGQAIFPDAIAALRAFRDNGGTVLLLTNAPRPQASVIRQLDRLDAPRDSYDAVVTSGDSAQTAMIQGMFGKRVYHLGPAEKDAGFFLNDDGTPVDIERVDLKDAEGIVCTGLFDDAVETPDDYRATILEGVNRDLPLLCANPDIVVDVGETRIFCAGALAEAYSQAGGRSFYFGKPHPPIYSLARQRLTEMKGEVVPDERILCIGDGIKTDVAGASGEALDCLFVAGGLAAQETGVVNGTPDAGKLQAFLNEAQLSPRYSIGFLR